MNLLENYIKEVHSETIKNIYGTDYILADVTADCYGNIQRSVRITTVKQWEIDKNKGFYMA